jgi:hypothetical protein
MDFEKIRTILADRDEPAYRFRQVYEGATRGLAGGYGELTALPAALRERLSEEANRATGRSSSGSRLPTGSRSRRWSCATGTAAPRASRRSPDVRSSARSAPRGRWASAVT